MYSGTQNLMVADVIGDWLDDLPDLQKETYRKGLNILIKIGLINPDQDLFGFSQINFTYLMVQIQEMPSSTRIIADNHVHAFLCLLNWIATRGFRLKPVELRQNAANSNLIP